jgi:carbon-monoxide dehydrogenase medium subunit
MALPSFEYHRADSLADLERLLSQHQGRCKILAGGTDILVQMKAGVQRPGVLVDIGALAGLQGITYQDGKGTAILAGTKIAALERSALIREKLPALHHSVTLLGSSQVRAMASLGGNACNASPSAETLPILIALGTNVTVAGNGQERTLPLESFFLGYRQVDLKAGEYLKSFFVPEQGSRTGSAYLCRTLRRAMEIDIVNVGVWFLADQSGCCQESRIALGSVAPTPVRSLKAEACLADQKLGQKSFLQAGEAAAMERTPIDDIRGSAEYRREMVKVLVARALATAFQSFQEKNGLRIKTNQ